MKSNTIKDIKEALKTVVTLDDPFIQQLELDERKGVQKLLQNWYKEQENIKVQHEKFNEMMKYENELARQGFEYIVGIDEVGRGPLAGPVVAAAVILPKGFKLLGINDSKQLSEKKREEYYHYIVENAISVGIGLITAEEIDQLNIYEATKKAMLEAITNLSIRPDYCLIDAMKLNIPYPQHSIIKGDALSVSIAAASIVAKVTRDNLMKKYSTTYPEYKFERHMGYGTKEHLIAIKKYGPCPIHRKTFAPIKNS
ncbi:ribonuclease HII [Heyndrickxia oleronia]|uniref:Ribonuclease HII n=1 Tax=Heyndrickxia oleronia TaxID=38875 RepID=A0AAW6SSL7_9BACI|nr:ribonuclease HII [Heyndrickxia oleronia]MDH5161173.1 ribonuclease HII [Heyndrickxia oleronia]